MVPDVHFGELEQVLCLRKNENSLKDIDGNLKVVFVTHRSVKHHVGYKVQPVFQYDAKSKQYNHS